MVTFLQFKSSSFVHLMSTGSPLTTSSLMSSGFKYSVDKTISLMKKTLQCVHISAITQTDKEKPGQTIKTHLN